MPSGPKKRKAAKKKMEIHQNDQPNTSSASATYHGDDDVKQVDDEDNEIEEGKGEIRKVGDVSNPSQVERNVLVEGDCDAEVENDCRSGDKSDEKDRSSSKSSSSSSNSSSGSDSDEESYGVHSAQESVDAPVDSVNSADSLAGRSDEPEVCAKIEDLSDSFVEKSPPVDPNTSLSVKEEEKDAGSPVHKSVASYLVESVSEENEYENPCSVEDKTSLSAASVDVPSGKEQLILQYMEKTVTIADQNQCTTLESEDRLRLPHCELKADDDNGVEYEKTYQVVEHLVSLVPCPVQTTSWKTCCGLFEVFTGSGR